MEPTQIDTEKIERQKRVVISALYWLIIGAGTILGIHYLLPVAMPFVLAYLIAWLLEKPISKVTEKIPIPRILVSLLMILLFVAVAGSAISLLSMTLVSWMRDGLTMLPDIMDKWILPFFEGLFQNFESWMLLLNSDVEGVLNTTLDGVYAALQNGTTILVNHLISMLGGLLAAVPSVLMKMLVTVIASVFISADFASVRKFVAKLIPKKCYPVLRECKEFFGRTLPRCLLSYVAIFMLTFAELSLGLSIIRIPNVATLAFLIALMDILPALGTGTVLIPWGIVSLFSGSIHRGIYLLILYGIIMVIRNVVEPRLIGKQIQLHPVLTLAGMITGLHFFGFMGLFGVPLTLAFLHQLHQKRILHLSFLD